MTIGPKTGSGPRRQRFYSKMAHKFGAGQDQLLTELTGQEANTIREYKSYLEKRAKTCESELKLASGSTNTR